MKVLLLSGYRIDKHKPLGLDTLDRRIEETSALGLEPIVVLSGPQADEILLSSKRLPDCELVYDTNEEVSLLTNLKAGLAASDQACFVQPVEIAPPSRKIWVGLKHAWQQRGDYGDFHVFQCLDSLGTLLHSGFPLLISGSGVQFFLKTEDLSGLLDPRIKFYHHRGSGLEPLAPSA